MKKCDENVTFHDQNKNFFKNQLYFENSFCIFFTKLYMMFRKTIFIFLSYINL